MTDNKIIQDFKVGDIVITNIGEVGKIIGFCDCDFCKDRCFYEPIVEVEIGNCSIYITDTDKRNGFSSFYKIGDQVFGNIDEDYLNDVICDKQNRIIELAKELKELNKQKDIISQIKSKDSNLTIF